VMGLLAGIAAGPIMAAVGGAALGATTGVVVSALIGMGIPEIEAKRASPFQKRQNREGALQTNDLSS
jgi:hypothetical protein